KAGQHDDGQLRMIPSEPFGNFVATHARHFVVQNDGINGFTAGYLKTSGAILGGEDGVTLVLKELLAYRQTCRIIVNTENYRLAGHDGDSLKLTLFLKTMSVKTDLKNSASPVLGQ